MDASGGKALSDSDAGRLESPSGGRPSNGVFAVEALIRAGSEFLVSRPRGMALAHDGIRALSSITRDREWSFAVGLIGLLHLWAVDLPASEKFHHSGRWGLIEHSLEVAAGLTRDLERRWRGPTRGSALSPGEQTLWSRVSFALGLFHDVGKIRDLEVRAQPECAAWNPLEEPLAFYRQRWGLTGSTPSPLRFRAGRGLRGHEALTLPLVRRIVQGAVGDALRPFLEIGLRAYHLRYRDTAGTLPRPFEYLTALLVEADRESTIGDRKRRSERSS